MKNMSNLVKAICIVSGVIVIAGLALLAWPLFAAIGTVILAILAMLLPIIVLVVAVVLVYRYLQSKDGE